MSLVIATRKTIGNEPGDLLVDIVIWRNRSEIRSHLYLAHVQGDIFTVVDGGDEGTRIFGHHDDVRLKPIDRAGYTHMVTQ